jgi:hypothetical protein
LGANGGCDFVDDGRVPVALRILNSIKGQMDNLTCPACSIDCTNGCGFARHACWPVPQYSMSLE